MPPTRVNLNWSYDVYLFRMEEEEEEEETTTRV